MLHSPKFHELNEIREDDSVAQDLLKGLREAGFGLLSLVVQTRSAQVPEMSGLHVARLLLERGCPAPGKGVHVGRDGTDRHGAWSCSLQQGMVFGAFLWGMYGY